jgi:hypothetical protein
MLAGIVLPGKVEMWDIFSQRRREAWRGKKRLPGRPLFEVKRLKGSLVGLQLIFSSLQLKLLGWCHLTAVRQSAGKPFSLVSWVSFVSRVIFLSVEASKRISVEASRLALACSS